MMASTIEVDISEELPHNPGEIVEINRVAKWRTEAIGHPLLLDIVSVGREKPEDPEIGIASFVVMELFFDFRKALGKYLAASIAKEIGQSPILLLTVEVKGACLTDNVFPALRAEIGNQLAPRTITLRKGKKHYMDRSPRVKGVEIIVPVISYYSITSPDEQLLTISPVDAEFLYQQTCERGSRLILAEDFLGGGGTVVAAHTLITRLDQQCPLGVEMLNTVAVAGSDGTLYKDAFREAGLTMKVIPDPLPVRLPTFQRTDELDPWQINT